MKNLICLIIATIFLMSSTCETTTPGGSGGGTNTDTCPSPGASQQQNAYVHLHWNYGGDDFYNVDQIILVDQLAPATFWTHQLFFNEEGGYIGLQTDGSGDNDKAQVLFSLWGGNACEAGDGAACVDFVEGTAGKSVRLPIEINEGNKYRLRVWYLSKDSQGYWWGAWAKNLTTNEESYIGKIRVPNSSKITGSVSFVEYWGGSFPNKDCVPQSISRFYPPTANNNDATNSFQYQGGFYYYNIGNGTNGNVTSTSIGTTNNVKKVVMGGK